MSDANERMLSAFDGHDVDGIRSALAAGADATRPVRGKLPVYWLLEEYHRTDRLPACLQLLIDSGAALDDRPLVAVLLDDAEAIAGLFETGPGLLTHRTSLRSAFTSLL